MTDSILGDRFIRAFEYAALVHGGDTRKSTSIPYISHLMAVAGIVLEYGGNEDEAIAALLHDAAEDHGGCPRLDDIRARFGAEVAEIVHGCSDSLTEDPDKKDPWPTRKSRYIAHLPQASASIRLVSAADKLHNARCILADYRREGPALWGRFNKESNQLWYYRSLLAAFQQAGSHDGLIDELARVVHALDEEMTKRGDPALQQAASMTHTA